MRMVLTDPRSLVGYGINLEKTSEQRLIISREEGGQLAIIDIVPNTAGNLTLRKPLDTDDDKLIKYIDHEGKPLAGVLPSMPSVTQEDKDGAQGTNWRVITSATGEKIFRCWHPKTEKYVDIPVNPTQGSHTPKGKPYEIVGQDEMLFVLSMGIAMKLNSLLVGPTGIGKTSVYRWLAWRLNYNLVIQPITRGTESFHLIGDYLPAGKADFQWTDGPVTEATRLSQSHPTILVFDELNRIGNLAELSRIYQLLDDTRAIEINEKRGKEGVTEIVDAKELFIGATSNPSDDEKADYIGVQDLDPALASRFPLQPSLGYPPVDVEIRALCSRVEGLPPNIARKMIDAGNRVRVSPAARFPLSFRELMAWGTLIPYFGYEDACEVAVISKAPRTAQASIRGLLKMQGN